MSRKRARSEESDDDDDSGSRRRAVRTRVHAPIRTWIKEVWGEDSDELILKQKLMGACVHNLGRKRCRLDQKCSDVYHLCNDYRKGICTQAPEHLDDRGRRMVHIPPTCKAVSIGKACQLGDACTYGHDHVDIQKIKDQGLLAGNLSRSHEHSTGRQAEKVVDAALRGEEYRSLRGNTYNAGSANQLPLGRRAPGSFFFRSDGTRRDS